MLKKSMVMACLAVMIAGCLISAGAADWPKKPIQILIPWPPANDPSTMVATAIAPVMSTTLGVPVKVVNKPGGGVVLACRTGREPPGRLYDRPDLDRPHDHPGDTGENPL